LANKEAKKKHILVITPYNHDGWDYAGYQSQTPGDHTCNIESFLQTQQVSSLETGGLGMSALIFVFLLGCVAGLRSLTAPAVVCWAAHFGWLHLTGTRLAFMNHRATLTIFTVLALLNLL